MASEYTDKAKKENQEAEQEERLNANEMHFNMSETSKSQIAPLTEISPVANYRKNEIRTYFNPASDKKTVVITGSTKVGEKEQGLLAGLANKKFSSNEFLNCGKAVLSSAEAQYMSADDLGSNAVGGAVEGVRLATQVFKTSQSVVEATPVVVKQTIKQTVNSVKGAGKAIVCTAKGTYRIATQAGLTTVAVVQAYGIAKGMQVLPISGEALRIFKGCALGVGLDKTYISQKLINAVHAVQSAPTVVKRAIKDTAQNIANSVQHGVRVVKDTAQNVVNTAKAVGNTVKSGYCVVKGVVKGQLPISYATYTAQMFAKKSVARAISFTAPIAKKTAKGALKGTWKSAKWATTKGIPVGLKTAKFGATGISTIASTVLQGDNYALQGLVYTAKGAEIATRLAEQTYKTGFSAVKGVSKAGIKTAQTTYNAGKKVAKGVQYAKNNGLKKAWDEGIRRARSATAKALAEAGKSVVTAIINLVKALGTKIVVPLILIVAVAGGGSAVISAPVMAVGSFFSGIFGTSDTNEEFAVREFMANTSYGIPHFTAETKAELADNMFDDWRVNSGSFDIVRLKTDTTNAMGDIIPPTIDGVSSVFYTDDQVIEMLEPLYNAILLKDYDLEPTKFQAKNRLKQMYNRVFTVTQIEQDEYCGQDLLTGVGTVDLVCADCGLIHAKKTLPNICPNQTVGTHTTWTCGVCDWYYYTCNGHKGVPTCGFVAHDHATDPCSYCATPEHDHATDPCSYCATPEHDHDTGGCDYCDTEPHIHGSSCCDIESHTMCTHASCGDNWNKDAEGNFIGDVCNNYHDHNYSACNRNVCGNQTEHSHGWYCCSLTEHSHGWYCCSLTAHSHGAHCCTIPPHAHDEWINEITTGCYSTTFCPYDLLPAYSGMSTACARSNSHFVCNGYSVCGSHHTKIYVLSMDGIYPLLQEEFYTPIASLSGLASPTEAQASQLSSLRTYLEIYEMMISMVSHGIYGGGMTVEELSRVAFLPNPSAGNLDVVSVAQGQYGAMGNTYWNYCGFTNRVEWSACFVHWCMRNSSASWAYPDTDNNSDVKKVAKYFTDNGMLKSNCGSVSSGDVIFFDWDGNGKADHMGIYVGTDGTYIYTIEGNAGDMVKIKKYSVTSSVIYGYGDLPY